MRVFDAQGYPVEVGMFVGDEGGTVVEITEPDGDVNSYGRAVAVGPFVVVKYVNPDVVEKWLCSLVIGYENTYRCHDIVVVRS